jgi:outer membrane protein assembly factor BamD
MIGRRRSCLKSARLSHVTDLIACSLAQEAIDDNLPTTAIRHLKDLDRRYPFGEYTVRAELDLIYAQLLAGNYIEANATAGSFIKNHPDHLALDYAYYMKGLVTYTSTENFLDSFFSIDPSKRDASDLTKSFNEFADFLARFPESQYAPDAKARMIYLRNIVARHELQVASYYFKRKAPLSALRRAQEVLSHYPEANTTEDALAISVQAYLDLKQFDLAKTNMDVLTQYFPNSRYIDDSGKFIPLELPKDADPDFLYWVSLGAIQ